MKKLYMYMIIIFSIMIIPINVNAEYIRPTRWSYAGTDSTGSGQWYEYVSSLTEDSTTFYQPMYEANFPNGVWNLRKVGIEYNLTNYNSDYFTIQVELPAINVSASTSNGIACDIFQGANTNMIDLVRSYSYSFVCQNPKSTTEVQILITPSAYSDSKYMKFWINKNVGLYNDKTTASSSAIVSSINSQTQQQQQQNNIINNTDSSGNANNFNSTVNNATLPNTSHGFDILGSLQTFISGINVSGSCNRISVPIPFTNQTLILPCMTTDVYSVHFPEIVVIWQLIVRGVGYYYILVNILKLIKETIDPFNFKLEVMDL